MDLGVDLADGFGDIVVHTGIANRKQVLGLDDAGDGGGGQAEDAQDIGELVGVGIGEAGFDQAAGEDADEGNLFEEAGGVGGFDAIEVAFFYAAGIEAML